jgi:DNA mismatch repair protein MSH3
VAKLFGVWDTQCTPQELATLLPAFHKLGTAFDKLAPLAVPGSQAAIPAPSQQIPLTGPFNSALLNSIIHALPLLKAPMEGFLRDVDIEALKAGRKEAMWRDVRERAEEVDDVLVVSDFLFMFGRQYV